jgi:hypothetical protein
VHFGGLGAETERAEAERLLRSSRLGEGTLTRSSLLRAASCFAASCRAASAFFAAAAGRTDGATFLALLDAAFFTGAFFIPLFAMILVS